MNRLSNPAKVKDILQQAWEVCELVEGQCLSFRGEQQFILDDRSIIRAIGRLKLQLALRKIQSFAAPESGGLTSAANTGTQGPPLPTVPVNTGAPGCPSPPHETPDAPVTFDTPVKNKTQETTLKSRAEILSRELPNAASSNCRVTGHPPETSEWHRND